MKGMISMAGTQIRDNIIKNLDKLPVDLQKKVQDFVNALVSTLPKGTSGVSFLQFAEDFSKDDADEMIKVINEGCEKVDLNEW